MPTKYLLFLCFLSSVYAVGQPGSTFSQVEVLEDLDYLYASLHEAQYDVYAYTTEAAFDSTYRTIRNAIDQDSLGVVEATNVFQRMVSAVKVGHTSIDFPGQAYGQYGYAGGTVFPLEIAIEDGKSLVRKNWSANDSIEIEAEILKINGLPMAEVLARMYPQISAERRYLANAKIEMYSFPRLYWQVFGRQDDFSVDIRSADSVQTFELKAVPMIDGYEMKRTEVIQPERALKFLAQAAYLHPGGFAGDEDQYRHFIDSALAEIKKRKSEHLIIDLRNHAGGNNSFSDYLVSYFADQPFRWNARYSLKTSAFLKEQVRKNRDTTDAFWREVLAHPNGEVYHYEFEAYQPQPPVKRYEGKVYVLINRQSHSQAAVMAAQVQDYELGTIVGEETGDYPSLYASQYQYPLPHTGIVVKVSKGYMVRVSGSTEQQGVRPDITIQDHLLDEKDEVLEGLLKRLEGK